MEPTVTAVLQTPLPQVVTPTPTPVSMTVCQSCHIQVRPTDYFCFNCGKSIHPKPLSISVATQLTYYVGSIILPPMGFIWGYKYLKETDPKAKMVGLVCYIITIVVLVLAVKVTVDLINTVNTQVNSQIQNIQGL